MIFKGGSSIVLASFSNRNCQVFQSATCQIFCIQLCIGNSLIKENHPDVNENGRRLLTLAEDTGFQICNGNHKTEGIWTFMKGPKTKTILDYLLLDDDLMDSFISLKVLDGLAPERRSTIISDHRPLMFELKMSISKVRWKPTKVTKWKIDDKTDWDGFAKVSDEAIKQYDISMDIKEKYRVIMDTMYTAGKDKIGFRKPGGGHRKVIPSVKLVELMSNQQNAFDEWSLAMGREDGSFALLLPNSKLLPATKITYI